MGLKWFKYLVIGIAALATMLSCSPCKELINTTVKETKDSVNTKTTITEKEKSVFTAADSAAIKMLVKCPENGVLNIPEVIKKSKNTTAKASIKNNVLSVDCKCDALEVKLKYQEKLTEIYRRHVNISNTVKVIEVKKIPKWAQYFMWIGAVAILGWIIKLVIKIYKIFI
jgi:hypothetical protein